jgi:uncharacterized protein
MRELPLVQLLADGKRLHLREGPIDLVIEAFGNPGQVRVAYQAAAKRFFTVLKELCEELPLLRVQIKSGSERPSGMMARRMAQAVAPYAPEIFVTPMAAVAGSVAEEILAAMLDAADISKAYVNDGGDIALHLSYGEQFVVGMVERPEQLSLFGSVTLHSDQPVRGIATSGWRGRSFSLGIADAVTVLADTASAADAAATLIANAVDLPGHPAIERQRACDIAPDSDLGERLVTRDVGTLSKREIDYALDAGEVFARYVLDRGLIHAAALRLQEETRIVESSRLAGLSSVMRESLAHA